MQHDVILFYTFSWYSPCFCGYLCCGIVALAVVVSNFSNTNGFDDGFDERDGYTRSLCWILEVFIGV